MTAYQRDDGADMVEYKPGRNIRRDVGLRLGLIAPEVGIGRGRPSAFAPCVDPQPEPVDPPPLHPSHENLVLAAPEPAPDVAPPVPAAAVPTRASKPRQAQRSLSAILAASDRGYRALRSKAKP